MARPDTQFSLQLFSVSYIICDFKIMYLDLILKCHGYYSIKCKI